MWNMANSAFEEQHDLYTSLVVSEGSSSKGPLDFHKDEPCSPLLVLFVDGTTLRRDNSGLNSEISRYCCIYEFGKRVVKLLTCRGVLAVVIMIARHVISVYPVNGFLQTGSNPRIRQYYVTISRI
jgi:hypothetical protein